MQTPAGSLRVLKEDCDPTEISGRPLHRCAKEIVNDLR